MVWKQGERVIYADRVHIGKELRASIVDNTSLVLSGVDTQYTGKYGNLEFPFPVSLVTFLKHSHTKKGQKSGSSYSNVDY